jgi:hypothetical protein
MDVFHLGLNLVSPWKRRNVGSRFVGGSGAIEMALLKEWPRCVGSLADVPASGDSAMEMPTRAVRGGECWKFLRADNGNE